MIVARDVAGSAGPRTHFPQRLFHRRQHRRMLPHAEIIVRAPDGNLGPDPMIESAREAAATPLEIGKDAVAPLGAQRIEALTEEGFVVHRRHAQQNVRFEMGAQYKWYASILRKRGSAPCPRLFRGLDVYLSAGMSTAIIN